MSESTNPPAPTPWDGQPYSIKRHGVSITNCDSEPVQTPGCVQDHGALLVLRMSDLTILQASENCAAILGVAPGALLGRTAAAVLGASGEGQLLDFLEGHQVEANPLYLTSVPAQTGDPLDVTVHSIEGVLVLEFEATGRGTAVGPDTYALVKRAVARMQATGTLQEFFDAAVDEIRDITGLDRVMVYRFHEDLHGEVVAEARREDLNPWLGFHYPAEDIPAPAREIFKRIWIRPVPRVSGGLAELVPLANPDTGRPLTMTHCALRGPSVMYTEYLQNMGVSAAFTMSIRQGDALWGLVACHHYAGEKHLSYQVRAACELIAQVVSLQRRAAEDREHLLYRLKLEGAHQQLVAHAALTGELTALVDGTTSLLEGMDASGAALRHQNRWWRIGRTPDDAQLEALSTWLFERPEFRQPVGPLYVTDKLAREYPEAASYAAVASGILALPLSRASRTVVMWFRPETLQTVKWGGNPNEKPSVPGPHGPRLTPRVSFELFAESVHQRSLPWKSVEIDTALRLRSLVLELVVNRAERLAELNTELMRKNEELDAFAHVASHDLKEPLRGIHKYAHQLREDAESASVEYKSKLDRMIWLTLRMDSLLDSLLQFARGGRATLVFEVVDLNEVVAEAREMIDWRSDTARADIVMPRPLPSARCDRVRCREVFVNLLTNALKYHDKPERKIEIGYIGRNEDHARTGCPPEAEDQTIYFVRDNGIGIDPKHHGHVFKIFRRLHGRDEYGGGTGVGLTIVKNLIERQEGRLWLDSTPGQGSTFYFTLPQKETTA